MMDDLTEDDTFVKYTEDGELVFQAFGEKSDVSLKVTDMLAETEDITSESDWSDQLSPQRESMTSSERKKHSGRNSTCPVSGCQFRGRKLKFHVQAEHMPRILWDNP
jgi:hypothetical protein